MSDPGAAGVTLSVVLPVLNEARDLGPLLDDLEAQAEPEGGFEIVVADGGSTDGTRELLEERAAVQPRLRWVENPGRRSCAGRNAGARAARGRYLLFIDGHCRLGDPEHLTRLVALFETQGAAAVCRAQSLLAFDARGWPAAIAQARHAALGHKPGSEIYGGTAGPADPRSSGAAYPRAVWERLGGYDERFDACEDVEFNHRVRSAGLTAYYDPGLVVAYRPRQSPAGLWRQMVRYGRGRARLMAKHPGTAPGSLIATSTLLLAGLVALAVGGPWRVSVLVLGAAWLGACLASGLAARGSVGHALRTAWCLVLIHLGLTLGFLAGLVDLPRFVGRTHGTT